MLSLLRVGVCTVANFSSGNVWGINRVKGSSEVEKLAHELGIRPESAAWLTLALDPFHDTEVKCTGLPDTTTANTFVLEVKKQVTVTKPAGVVGPLWDCHMFTLPILDAIICHQGDVQAPGVVATPNAATDLTLNLFNIVCAEAGSPTLPNQTNGVTLAANDFITAPDFSTFFTGPARVVAAGWEVHNTTASLTKQGTVTTYRQEAKPTPVSMFHYVGTTSAFSNVANDLFVGPAWRSPMPPVDVESALLLPGARQWEAARGFLEPIPINPMDNHLETRAYGQVAFMDSDADYTGNKVLITKNQPGFSAFASKPSITVNTAAHTFNGGRVVRTAPVMNCGAYFTGLSADTTLTVTAKLFIERAPDASMPDLAPLAKPSASYDPRAFEIYLRTLHSLPPAVPVDMNASGDFWKMAKKVTGVASIIGSALFPEAAPLIGLGATAVNAIADSAQRRAKQKPKPRAKK